MLRHRSAVRNGNQTLGSHEVHVGGRGHGAATAAPAARPNLAVAAEVGLALPWLRTKSAARRGGQGGGGAGASDSQERRGDLSPSSLRNWQRLRTQHPQPGAQPHRRLSPPPLPGAWRDPPGWTGGRARLPFGAGSLGKMPHVAIASLFD